MHAPDFAQLSHPTLPPRDINFLLSNFPGQVDVPRAVTEMGQFFNTLDSMLDADYLYKALRDADTLDLPVSPQLWFEVMLRHAMPARRHRQEQQALHYVAHLLTLFSRTERLRQVQAGDDTAYDYLVDLVAEEQAAQTTRQFVVQAHIANYALFLGGVCAEWIEHRHRYARRPVTVGYYRDMGASRFYAASKHPLAQEFGLTQTYRELAQRFDYYREGLEKWRRRISTIETGLTRRATLFAKPIEDTEKLVVPVITSYEVFKKVLRERGENPALRAASLMQMGQLIEVDLSLVLSAAQHSLPLADSLVYATARRHKATLWTQHAHFEGLPGVRYFSK